MSHELPVVTPIKPPVPPRKTTNPSKSSASAAQVSNLRKTFEDGKFNTISFIKLAFTYFQITPNVGC